MSASRHESHRRHIQLFANRRLLLSIGHKLARLEFHRFLKSRHLGLQRLIIGVLRSQIRHNRVSVVFRQFLAGFVLSVQKVGQRADISRQNRFPRWIRLHRRQNHWNGTAFHQRSRRSWMHRQFAQCHGCIVEEDGVRFMRLDGSQQRHTAISRKRLRILFNRRDVDHHLHQLVHHLDVCPVVVILGHFANHLAESVLSDMARSLHGHNHLANGLAAQAQNLFARFVLLHNLRHHLAASVRGQLGGDIRVGRQHFEQFERRGYHRFLKH
mmetsp:Transcript_25085/g.39868  ORF Transcript_25085/g.39868 Transcript_25085/m.39868 type:complete len:269 (+) Transcript_25085:598-1404(+)